MNENAFVHAASASGGILYVMALLLFVALTIMLERTWYLRRVLAAGNRVLARLDGIAKLQPSQLREIGESCAQLPHGRVLQATLKHDLAHDLERLSDKLEESIMREAPAVDRSLWLLDTIVTLAPLLGLLGTIIGMFNAFHVLSNPGVAPTRVTGGVAEALLATASGLFIAIIGLVAFNGLNNRVRIIVHQLETLKVMLVNRISPHYDGLVKGDSFAKGESSVQTDRSVQADRSAHSERPAQAMNIANTARSQDSGPRVVRAGEA